LNERIGSLEIGKQADFAAFSAKEFSEIIYNIGINLNRYTIKKGEIIYQNAENL
jgi:imidazolonepropionase-like amidohydrolase